MKKIVNPVIKRIEGSNCRVFVKIEYKDGRLSFFGVEGPRRGGNALGACGQIVDELDKDVVRYLPGWNALKVKKLQEIWKRWHLNDMRAECEHQRARGETWKTHPLAVCPDCGYKLGSAWLKEEVPQDILDWLFSLPKSKVKPAWI